MNHNFHVLPLLAESWVIGAERCELMSILGAAGFAPSHSLKSYIHKGVESSKSNVNDKTVVLAEMFMSLADGALHSGVLVHL